MAPVRRTLTCGQIGGENTGAKTAMTLINVVGRERIAILASLRNEVLSLPIHSYANRIVWTKSSLEKEPRREQDGALGAEIEERPRQNLPASRNMAPAAL
jgi:hypothetical protein